MLAAAAAAAALLSGPGRPAAAAQDEFVHVLTVTVPASGWLDTRLDLEQGRVYRFRAEGRISLQKGNPVAGCGPEGLDIRTQQQPLLGRNLGCLVAKVAQLISVRVDEETGEETRDEIVRLFAIGPEAEVTAPLSGRLYLGPNENVISDNDGDFRVVVWLKSL